MSLKQFTESMEHLSVGPTSFKKFVRDHNAYKRTKANLQMYSLKHFMERYHDKFHEYHGEYPLFFHDDNEEGDHEIMCLVDTSVTKEHTMKSDMRKKFRKAGSLRRKKLREKYSYRNPLNRIHAYIIVEKSPGETDDTTMAVNVICSSNYSDIKGIGRYIMKTTLESSKTAGFDNVVLEVGNQEADERDPESEEDSEGFDSESDDETDEDEDEGSCWEEEEKEEIEYVADIIASKLWRISVRHKNGVPLYNIGDEYIYNIVRDYLLVEVHEYEEWEPDNDDEEYGYGGYYYHKGKRDCASLMKYYESFGFTEDPKVNTEWKCFSIIPFPSMIKKL